MKYRAKSVDNLIPVHINYYTKFNCQVESGNLKKYVKNGVMCQAEGFGKQSRLVQYILNAYGDRAKNAKLFSL